jgi:hypothetical protein
VPYAVPTVKTNTLSTLLVPPSAAPDLSGLGFFPLYILFGNKCQKKNCIFIFHTILHKTNDNAPVFILSNNLQSITTPKKGDLDGDPKRVFV